MSYRFQTAFCTLGILCGSICLAQNYRCDWSVNGIAGGEMTGAYKCGSTAGQTAAGFITGSNYWALIGFWQSEGQVGVREQTYSPNQGPLVTRLYAPQPNPFRAHLAVRYSLAAEGLVTLRVHDLTGRVVRTLADGVMRPGRYSLTWSGTDDHGRELARGVYFCRLTAGDYRSTEKMVLQK
jgi:hypothetical protein